MADQFQKQDNLWKAKFKEFQDAMMRRLALASDPPVRAPEPHEDHGYMPESNPYKDYGYMFELAVGAPEPEIQPFSVDVSTLDTYFHLDDSVF